jgi:hypothetical protein
MDKRSPRHKKMTKINPLAIFSEQSDQVYLKVEHCQHHFSVPKKRFQAASSR